MTPTDEILYRLYRAGGGAVLGAVDWPLEAVARLVADGLVEMEAATARPVLTAAGRAVAQRLVSPAGGGIGFAHTPAIRA